MLIDTSYFFGPVTIAQSSEESVAANIQAFINQYEPEFLNNLLGRQLYADFKAGLLVTPMASKWTDLLYGTEYVGYSSQLQKWVGLVSISSDISSNSYWPYDIQVVVGSGVQYAPVAVSTEYHNPFLIGKQYRIVRRGTGPLLTSEFTQLSDGFSLIAPDIFTLGEIFFIQFTAPTALPSGGTISLLSQKQSPIANYVYYKYMQDNASFTTGSGEKIVNQQNGVNVTPGDKMRYAWNQMVTWNRGLIEFLQVSRQTYYYDYPYYYSGSRDLNNLLGKENLWGI